MCIYIYIERERDIEREREIIEKEPLLLFSPQKSRFCHSGQYL